MVPTTTPYGNTYNKLRLNLLLAKQRMEKNITQREMAEILTKATGKTFGQSEVSRIERHVLVLDEDLAEGLAKVLSIPLPEVKEMIAHDARSRDRWRKRIRAEVGEKLRGSAREAREVREELSSPLKPLAKTRHEHNWNVLKANGEVATLICLECLDTKDTPILVKVAEHA